MKFSVKYGTGGTRATPPLCFHHAHRRHSSLAAIFARTYSVTVSINPNGVFVKGEIDGGKGGNPRFVGAGLGEANVHTTVPNVRLLIYKAGGASPSPTRVNGWLSYPCRGVAYSISPQFMHLRPIFRTRNSPFSRHPPSGIARETPPPIQSHAVPSSPVIPRQNTAPILFVFLHPGRCTMMPQTKHRKASK